MSAARKEEACLVIRFVNEEGQVEEDFLGFFEATDTTGEGLTNLLIDSLTRAGLSLENCRGQSYDGASCMSGLVRKVQTRVCKIKPLAVYTHCVSHSLNLVVAAAVKEPTMRGMFGTLKAVSSFLLGSAKRVAKFGELVDELGAVEGRKKRLKLLCATRWVESHECVVTFLELLHVTAMALEYYADEGVTEASAYLAAIRTAPFIVSLVVAEKVMALLLPLSVQLQKSSLVIGDAMTKVQHLADKLDHMRENAEKEFRTLFDRAAKEAKESVGLDGGLAAPRRVGRQVHRNAVPGDTAEQYYRRNVFIPFLDDVRQALRLRFEHKPVYALQLLIPGCRTTEGDHVNEIMRVAEVYQEDLDVALSVVHGEVET